MSHKIIDESQFLPLFSQREAFKQGFQAMQRAVHSLAKDKGWYDPPKTFPESVALMHSELSEALESYRDGLDPSKVYYDTNPYGSNGSMVETPPCDGAKPEGVAIELADCIIRILDTAEYLGIDLAEAILQKHHYNQSRPHRHGGKKV